jgi:hypothetical protein
VSVSERSDRLPPHVEPTSVTLVTARLEAKYFIAHAEATRLCHRIEAQLASHHHSAPPGFSVGSARHHITTTVYFDTARRDLCRAAMRAPVHLKVRARTYHEEPGAGSPLPPSEGSVWLELKERDGTRSHKRRAPFDRTCAGELLAALALDDHAAAAEACEAIIARQSEPVHVALLADLAHTRAVLGAALVPSCVVRYRRQAFQDVTDTLRVTLDYDVRAFRAPPAPFAEAGLAQQALGEPAHEEAACVLETKSLGPLPDWLVALLAEHGARPVDYSKLVMASLAVHGAL